MKENKKRPPSSGAHRRRQGNRQNQMHSSHQQSQPFQRNGAHQTSFPAKKPSPPTAKTSRISITKTRAAAFLPRIRLSRKVLPVLPFLSGVRSLPVRFSEMRRLPAPKHGLRQAAAIQAAQVEGLLKQFHSVEPIIGMETLITTATRFPPPLRWHEISRSFPGCIRTAPIESYR